VTPLEVVPARLVWDGTGKPPRTVHYLVVERNCSWCGVRPIYHIGERWECADAVTCLKCIRKKEAMGW
jgi:hypothetical protein